jgi:hypothetical protein
MGATWPDGEWGGIVFAVICWARAPRDGVPDRALCLPTSSHFLIVNKFLSPSLPTTHHHRPLPPSSHFPTSPLLAVVQSSTVNPPTRRRRPSAHARTVTRRPPLSMLGGGLGRLLISAARRAVAAACAALEAFDVKKRLRSLVAVGAENLDLRVAFRNSEKSVPFSEEILKNQCPGTS